MVSEADWKTWYSRF